MKPGPWHGDLLLTQHWVGVGLSEATAGDFGPVVPALGAGSELGAGDSGSDTVPVCNMNPLPQYMSV